MEKIRARFVTPKAVKTPGAKSITTDTGIRVEYVDYDEETTKIFLEQSSHYVVRDYYSWYREDNVRNTELSGDSIYGFVIKDMLSISSPVYHTNEPQLDILIVDGEFAGVVIKVTQTSQSTWSSDKETFYCILYKDGTKAGNNKGYFSSSLEDSSTDDEWEYYLHKID